MPSLFFQQRLSFLTFWSFSKLGFVLDILFLMATCDQSDDFSDASSDASDFPDIPSVGAFFGRPLKTPICEISPEQCSSRDRLTHQNRREKSWSPPPRVPIQGPARVSLPNSEDKFRGEQVFDSRRVKVEREPSSGKLESTLQAGLNVGRSERGKRNLEFGVQAGMSPSFPNFGGARDERHVQPALRKGREAQAGLSPFCEIAPAGHRRAMIPNTVPFMNAVDPYNRKTLVQTSVGRVQTSVGRVHQSRGKEKISEHEFSGRGPVKLNSQFENVANYASDKSGDCPSLGNLQDSSTDSEEMRRKIEEDPVYRRQVENFKRSLQIRSNRNQKARPDDIEHDEVLKQVEETTPSRITSTIVGKRHQDSWKDTVNLSSDGGGSRSDGGQSEQSLGEMDRPMKKKKASQPLSVTRLTDRSIRSTSRKFCCRNHCLLSLDMTGIREAREQYFRQKSQDRSSSLQWLVNQSGNKGEGGRLCYSIGKRNVCREAFKNVFCVGNDRLSRITKLGNRDVMPPKAVGRPKAIMSLVVTSWLHEFFKTRVESLPNKNVLHLPDNYTKFEVWKIFQCTFGSKDETAKNITYRAFVKIWNEKFPNVKIPPVSRFSACADCEEFKALRDKASSQREKGLFLSILLCPCFWLQAGMSVTF